MSELTHPEVFKAYDVRGLFGDEIDPAAAVAIGRSFARVIGALEGKPTSSLRLGLGRDMRLTAPQMAQAYRDGMMAEGATVLDAGMVGTEMLYYLVGSRKLDGGLMCTASHNPKAYTGAKLVGAGALALSGEAGLGDVRDRILNGLGDSPGCRLDLEDTLLPSPDCRSSYRRLQVGIRGCAMPAAPALRYQAVSFHLARFQAGR